MFLANSLYDPRYSRIIERLVAARKAAGLTQRDVATKLKQPPSFLGKIESKQRRVDLVELLDLVEAIGVKPSKFIADVLSDLKKR